MKGASCGLPPLLRVIPTQGIEQVQEFGVVGFSAPAWRVLGERVGIGSARPTAVLSRFPAHGVGSFEIS